MTHDTTTTESTADSEVQTAETPTDGVRESPALTRRRLVGSGLAAIATGLAGCSGSGGSSSDGGSAFSTTATETTAASSNNGVFESVNIDGEYLTLRFKENSAPLDIHIIDESGKEVRNEALSAGTLAEINLVPVDDDAWRYSPGTEYKLVAQQYDSEVTKVGEATFSAVPNLSITGVDLSKGRLDIEVTNSGSGPSILTDAGFRSDSDLIYPAPIDTEGDISKNTVGKRGVPVPARGKATVRVAGIYSILPSDEDTPCGSGQLRVTVEEMTGTRHAAETTFSLKKTDDDPFCDDAGFSGLESVEPSQKTMTTEG